VSNTSTTVALDRLNAVVTKIGPMVVAFSGGVDSSLLAVAARRSLGADQIIAVTADSPSLATGELDQCQDLAAKWDIPWLAVKTDEASNENYLANTGDRCYWCKDALMEQLGPIAAERSATVVLGVNTGDLSDHRPGQKAAAERGARFPLVEAEMGKDTIRALAKTWGLSVWDRPAMPCLASRIPYGTAVTVPLLGRIDRAEAALRALGFNDLRVRHYGDEARIELPTSELVAAAEQSETIVGALQEVGYSRVTLDLEGLRSGNLNQALTS